MKKHTFLLIVLLFSTNFSKKTPMLAEDDSIIISTSFEDDDFSMFTPRGDDDTSVLVIKDKGKTGDKCLAVTERSESWNGAQYDLEKNCEPGGQYLVSAALRTEWYCNICLSMQFTDDSGDEHYSNLKCMVSQGEWVQIKEFKFSMPVGCSKVYLYFENTGGNNDFFIDDFELKKAPEGKIERK